MDGSALTADIAVQNVIGKRSQCLSAVKEAQAAIQGTRFAVRRGCLSTTVVESAGETSSTVASECYLMVPKYVMNMTTILIRDDFEPVTQVKKEH